MADESVQLKTLQTILIMFQSRLQPESEENMAQALGICLRLLENNRSSDSVRNTAAATFRQAVALIFDHVVRAESLPAGKLGSGGYTSRSSSVTSDVNRSINRAETLEHDFISGGPSMMRETLTKAGKLGLRLLEDLTALAAGGSASWLRVSSIQRRFTLDILEFILSNYVVVFRTLVSYEQVLRHQICSLLMTSLRTNAELEGEAEEPYFRRLVLRSVAHIIRLYGSALITECEVFLSMLVKVISLDLPLWHRILVLEVLRGFCVEAWTLRTLFQNFDMKPKNTNVVEGMVKALARVVSSVQVQDTSEESLAAVAGMFSSKAKGIEWSLENDASNAAVLVASEAHTITLAIEGLLGVVFTVATLTDEAVDVGELESPRCDSDPLEKCTGETAVLCVSMVDSMWLTILDSLSLILAKSQGEAIVLEILKGYQAFTQACGVLRAVEPLNSFLASLCKFTISIPSEPEKKSALQSPNSKRSEMLLDQRESVVLTPKNVQALRTLFNVAHRLHNVLGPSWVLVLETLSALDRAIHSPHATTQQKICKFKVVEGWSVARYPLVLSVFQGAGVLIHGEAPLYGGWTKGGGQIALDTWCPPLCLTNLKNQELWSQPWSRVGRATLTIINSSLQTTSPHDNPQCESKVLPPRVPQCGNYAFGGSSKWEVLRVEILAREWPLNAGPFKQGGSQIENPHVMRGRSSSGRISEWEPLHVESLLSRRISTRSLFCVDGPMEVSATVPKLTRESSGQYSDFSILSSLNSQLFESSALMHISAVKSLLSALCQLSHQCVTDVVSGLGQASGQKIGSISFSVERMISILVNNLHRVEPLWDQVVGHFLELADNSNQQLRNKALDALDQSICAVLGSDQFQENTAPRLRGASRDMEALHAELRSLECAVVSPLRVLYFSTQSNDVRVGSLKILLHVLERHGEKLHYSWPNILELLRSVADSSEKDLVTLGFQSLRVIMNDGLSYIPADCLHVCIDVTGAYSAQNTELNISLTAIGLLWTTTDFIAKGLLYGLILEKGTGIMDVQFTPKQMNSVNSEEQDTDFVNGVSEQAPLMNIVDRDKLLFSVFSLLQKLGADERPEVRNSAVRTLFQTLGSHGQKLSNSMWEDCLWNYVFPTLDRASHMAATSSKDEWHGKELGTRGGKAVHMLIHHSRNTAQKQWDETLVLVLGGVARLLRSFFPFLRSLRNFWSGWESLLLLVKNSILHGSKEVGLAAINCLQSTVISHSPKGNLPLDYLKSVLEVYELVLQNSQNYGGNATSKVKQEILHGLGDLYVQANGMFDSGMYTRLLGVIHMAVKQAKISNNNFEAEFVNEFPANEIPAAFLQGHVPPVQRAVLEILPLLHPAEHLSSMWSLFLGDLLQYLPISDSSLQSGEDEPPETSTGHNIHASSKMMKPEIPNATGPISPKEEGSCLTSGSNNSTAPGISSYLLAEKLVPVLVDLFLQAPLIERPNIFPEIVQGLGRCMITRRDSPEGSLWRLAVEGFNRILVDDVRKLTTNCGADPIISRPARIRFWKEVADVYEIFLMGYCGRALPSNCLSATALKADESLEMNILDILGDKILKSQIDAPPDILQLLVSTLDRCASRTCCLPIETVELMPSHCSRFSLTCLQKLFSLSSYTSEVSGWNLARSEMGKISIVILLARCEYILRKFLIDENDLGDRPLPPARLEEIIFVLQELGRLVIHSDMASVLPLHPYLKVGLVEENHDRRPHLFVLFPSFCELVISR
ncbi:ARM repeat superfamily protein [Actinidia rufa]|uniref:ARM repeat superfamily protein n=1 Tax=Actinidia rufa TaxID=165716 RepID=A0A7J0EVY1_9ERIC|nr:ARM repeat superfamily protein [Actinidia rufa]